MHDEWERMPGMQRLITLDGVIYVQQNPKRKRRAPVAAAEANVPEPEPDLDLEAVSGGASEGEAVRAAGTEVVTEPQPAEAPVAAAAAEEPCAPAPYAEVQQHGHTVRIVRNNPAPPPPGYAIEFGSGRLVPLHTFRGRMSYPTGIRST